MKLDIVKCEDACYAVLLAALGVQTFTESFGQLYRPDDLAMFLREKHSPEMYRRLLTDPNYAVWIARTETGEAVAYLVAGPCDLPISEKPETAGELARFYVCKSHQGAGLGERMMAQAIAWLEENFDHVYLSVYSKNHGAQRFYARHGFEKVQEYYFMVGNHADPEFILKRQ